MSIDAMKQALEALWNCTAKLESQLMRNPVILPTNYKDAVAEGYTAHSKLRAAIEAAEKQEPVAWKDTMHTDHADGRKEHEPMLLGYAGWEKLPDGTDLYTTLPQPAIPEWQPIETAPRDGVVILLGLPAVGTLKDASERRVYEGRWNEVQNAFTSVNGFILLAIATHWMPLPAAPEVPK